MTPRIPLLALLVLLLARPALAQKDARVPDTDPEVELQSFEVADGFEVNLFASDPDIAKPIQMNFDAQGRLWVASSSVYPQLKPGQEADDKILVLEDTDADGTADQFTTFADGLLIPTGLEPGDGGVYAANSTELLFLKDTDEDGKADSRKVVLSGFGTEDTHHILHTFRWGNDGFLYFNQSTYIHSTVETPWGPRYLGGGGIWQFRPDSVKLEVFTRGLINPWGHAIDRWGQHFATDGAGGEGINDMVPGASYAWTPNEKRIVAGLNPGSPKYCGLEVVSGRAMPDDMQGVLVTNDFRANRVCRFRLSEDGSSYSSRELPELIKTRFAAFRPVDVKLGPDGALYIADWYNPIIQHGEVDFRDPRRDHSHGRIWRVTAKGRPLVERPRLTKKSIEEVLDALKAPEAWTRHFAKRVLSEKDPKVVLLALAKWVEALDPDDVHARLEALWLYQTLNVPRPDLLVSLLDCSDHRARAAAVKVVPHWQSALDDPLSLLAQRVVDDHPRVRLEAVRALEQFTDPRAVEIALQALDLPVDKTLDYALWLTARNLQSHWLPELEAGNLDFGGDTRRLTFALQAAGSPEVVAPLLQAVSEGTVSAEKAPEIFRLVGSLGSPEDLARGIEVAFGSKDPARTLSALVEGARPRNVHPAGNLDAIAKALDNPEDLALRLASASAAGVWKVERLRPVLTRLALDPATSESLRAASIASLGQLGGQSASETLSSLAKDAKQPVPIRLEAVKALAPFNLRASASLASELLEHGSPDLLDISGLVGTFSGRKGGPGALASALKGKTLSRDVATLALRAARSSGKSESALTRAISKAGKLDAPKPPPSPEEVQKLAKAVQTEGDPASGETIFRRDSLKCLFCHSIAGAGGQVGPGLESIGASAPVDYLIDSLLQPNKAIKEGYHSVVVATDDGRILTGIVQVRDDQTLTLRDADGQSVTVATESVEAEKPGESLMPAGLTDPLTRPEFLDLVRFLSELGKAGPYSVSPRRFVRRWETLPGTRAVARVLAMAGPSAETSGPALAWTPVYSTVSGELPLQDLPLVPIPASPSGLHYARFSLDVSTPGNVKLNLNNPNGLTLWLDGQMVEPASSAEFDLTAGRHVVTLAVDPSRRPDKAPLSVELVDVPGSPAKVQPVLR